MHSTNSRSMQKSNLAAVLRTVQQSGGIARRDVALQTGLTPAAVTNITAGLIRDGYLVETGENEQDTGLGRKPVILKINPARHCMLGVELSADNIVAVLADFAGRVLAQSSAPNRPDTPPDKAVHLAWQLAAGLLAESCVKKETALGLGLVSSGPQDRAAGTLLNPPNFSHPAWNCAPVKALMEEASGLPVLVDRDSVGCALAESGAAGQTGTLFAIMVNTVGIGGGFLVGHEVFYGLNNAAAEIGHMTVLPGGPLCGCGDRGCLEAAASGVALARALSARRAGKRPLAPEDVAAAFRAGEPDAVEAVHTGAECLGRAVGNVIKCLSPDAVAIGGRFISMLPDYYTLACEYAEARHYVALNGRRTRLIPFSKGMAQAAVGAVQLVSNEFYRALAAP